MDVKRLFERDPALYADMDWYLKTGEWEIACDGDAAIWLRWKRGWLHAIAALNAGEARRLLARIPDGDALVLRGCAGLREPAEKAGFNGCHPCVQVVYEKKTPVAVSTELTIRHPDEADFPKFAESYELADSEAELRADFSREDFLGGYLGAELVGYAGLHGEGSMGLLHVFPAYRRRGYAEALYGTLINNQLKKGRLPFAQIIEGNDASLALQRKLGFTVAREPVFWLWRE